MTESENEKIKGIFGNEWFFDQFSEGPTKTEDEIKKLESKMKLLENVIGEMRPVVEKYLNGHQFDDNDKAKHVALFDKARVIIKTPTNDIKKDRFK